MKKAAVSWVFVGPEPHMATCRRCGKHEPKPELPTSFEAAIKYLEYITEKHRYCEEAS
jgi:hypothetical protein